MLTRRLLLAAALAALAMPAAAEEPPIFAASELAIRGYDPVAYFTEGKPVEGSAAHQLMWMGATWRFASAANRDRFERNPQKFAPQYGGYCAFAASQGYVAPTDPAAFTVHDGKLYLNYSQRIRRTWEKDIPGHVSAANANWPKPLKK
ncbi:YHS domain-containing (seleno)protein [Oceanicola sp. 502str15]|uniref:YHS domain-containing (seleno)protein n=1 Tax=Oceanicola sp. 502str15 TaxID=2696061 RepID=UPI002094D370|nr:YHS domain-containing (seleno)protein [Oceanicola sp. 502str15]MCO6382904.1 YHS domain-containing protein [Oceanicola sp. 502str15]